MKKYFFIVVVAALVVAVYILWKYAFPEQVCGKPPGWFKACFPGYQCTYPNPTTGIDTDFGVCKQK